jgi:hypothetical protein
MWWKKKGIANEFQKKFDPNSGNVLRKKFEVYAISLSWKLLKLSPQTRFKVFFSERDPFSARKTSLFISITSLIGMEWTKAFLVHMDLSSMAQFSFVL